MGSGWLSNYVIKDMRLPLPIIYIGKLLAHRILGGGTNYLPHGGEIKGGMHLAGRENWPTLINDPKGERE